MHASAQRSTRFEVLEIKQGPNSFALVCAHRATPSRGPMLEVYEEAFTDAEMQQIHAALELLETKYASVYDAWNNEPAQLASMIESAVAAKAEAESLKQEIELLKQEKERLSG